MENYPVRQIAYFVPDIEAAAMEHHRLFGSGPYFVARNIPLAKSLHRGVERLLDHSSAYGQWGDIMIEFIQQNNPGPSVFRDIYKEGSGQQGLHHMAIFVGQIEEAIDEFSEQGFETALYAEVEGGGLFAMIDMINKTGHMLELYEPSEGLLGFYKMVADAANDYDGTDPLREISF